MKDVSLLLEVLKFLAVFYGFYKSCRQREKEKATRAEMESITNRLNKLENVNQFKQLDE